MPCPFRTVLLRVAMLIVAAPGCAAAKAEAPTPAAAPAGVAAERWVQRHYGSADGLPVSSAQSAQIDTDGFLWLATHDGLARFDGQRFDVYDSMRFPAMSGNRVLAVYTDMVGRLFAHTAHGDWLAIRSGQLERVPLGASAVQLVRYVDEPSLCVTTSRALHCPDGEGGFPLFAAFPDGVAPALALPAGDDAVWLVTTTGEVWRRQPGQGWHAIPDSLPPAGIPISANAALLASDGTLWVGNRGPLLAVSPAGVAQYWVGDGKPSMVLQLREDRRGVVWIDAVDGIYRVEDGHPRRVLSDPRPANDAKHLSWEAPDGAVWLRAGHRLWRVPDASAVQTDVLAREPVLHTRGDMLDMLFGDDGTAWVMTLRDGIHRLSRARVDLLDESAGLGEGNVYGVSRDRDGTMWLGTLGEGLKSIDRDGTVRRHGADQGLPGVNPWAVAAMPDGGVFTATYAPGLWYRAPDTDQFVALSLPDDLRDARVLAIVHDHAERVWLGTSHGAWRREGDTWTRQWPATLRAARVNALAFGEGDEVWFGGSEGVWRRHGGREHAVAPALLAQTSVRDVYRASDGVVWVSTDGRGLVRVAADDPDGVQAVRLGRAQGLPSNSPHAVREDRNGHLWVNSNQGLFRIARTALAAHLADTTRPLSPLVLGLSDGLTELEGNGGVQPAADVDDLGRLWFPSQRGIVRFDPTAIPLREQAPRAVIDGLESEGRALQLVADGMLPSGVRSVLIRYGAADLHAGAEVRYRYRLLPKDQGWTDAGDGRSAGFAHLAAGDYRFEVLAGNGDGFWASTPTVLAFRVPAYWFETTVSRVLLAVAAAGLLLLLAWRRGQRLRRRAAELDKLVDERTDELRTEKGRVETALSELSQAHQDLAQTHAHIEDRNVQLAEQADRLAALDRFRTRVLADVSHELRTPVMLVSLPLRELQAQSADWDRTQRQRLNLSLGQLDRLGGLVEQLVDLVQAESGQIRLAMQRVLLAEFLAELVDTYRAAADKAGATLTLRPSGGSPVVLADPARLVTVIGNLVDNALKYAPTGSEVLLRLEHDDEHAVIEVSDTGPGFDAAVAERLFDRFYRVEGPPRHGREGLGIGLALARELVDLHGGRIRARGTPGHGALFRVELPLGSAHVALDELALDEPRAASVPVTVPDTTRGEGRLLLVEDHPELAHYLAERLGEHLPVVCVGSAERAIALLEGAHDIRVVVSDVVLPGASGLDLCRQVMAAEVAQRCPVILISAKAAAHDREAGLAAGAAAYLAKPFSFEALLDAVASVWPVAAPRLRAVSIEPAESDPLLRVALDNLADPDFAVTAWSDRVHLSERQLRRRVNELTGQSPQTWLREQRLLRVRQLIRSGACKTLAEAGARAGLDNASYLYRSYRARFGSERDADD